MKEQIIKAAEDAISKGFGNYYVMSGLTWNDLLSGYQSGNRLIDYQESEILASV